jgi:Domain of unknown function (DUF4372)/Transposase DDE domain
MFELSQPEEPIMNSGKTLFAQLMHFVPWTSFSRIVKRYDGNARSRRLNCAEHFRIMAFAQITWRESLRDIEATLGANAHKLYALGLRYSVHRSTLADANEARTWRIWQDVALLLLNRARKSYRSFNVARADATTANATTANAAPLPTHTDTDTDTDADTEQDFTFDELTDTIYALDSTMIDLCLSLFNWAAFDSLRASVKMHTLLDLRSAIPAFIHLSMGTLNDIKALAQLRFEPGAFYVMDRGYVDFSALYSIDQSQAFFVIRAKSNLLCQRRYSHAVDKRLGLMCDQTIAMIGPITSAKYPAPLRRIRFKDRLSKKVFVYLTNNMALPAYTICQLYKSRWQVELFFKWIKQHLRIKQFLGRSENAVKTQIWCAMATYALIATVKYELRLNASLYTILQILSVSLFEKTEPSCAFAGSERKLEYANPANQLNLFEF